MWGLKIRKGDKRWEATCMCISFSILSSMSSCTLVPHNHISQAGEQRVHVVVVLPCLA